MKENTTQSIATLETPRLLLDMDIMEANISDIVRFAKENKVSYRPHIKTHKSVKIAKRQVELGAIGITVAKVGEAEVMAKGGINNILIAYPVSARTKLKRIMNLMDKATITVTVDSIEQAKILNEFFSGHHKKLNVWIKVNSGLNRCGVEPNEEVVELATYINKSSSLLLSGIYTHAGHSYAVTSAEEIEAIAKEEASAVLESVKLCENIGIAITHRSIGSTPTFKIAGAIAGITEIRPGNAVFYDMVQVGLGLAKKDQCALTVLSAVVTKKPNRLVIDAGSKTLALDQGAHGNKSVVGHGFIIDHPHLIVERLSEEHGVIPLDGEEVQLELTDKISIIPNHACTVANLFDSYVVHQNGQIIDRWSVDARGRVD